MEDIENWKYYRQCFQSGNYRYDDFLREVGVWCAPVPIYLLLSAMGVNVLEYDMTMEGFLDARNEVPRIGVNRHQDVAHQRFMMAHAFVHLMKHPLGVAYRDTALIWEPESFIESEATNGAFSLLMPKTFLLAERMKTRGTKAQIASRLMVTPEALGYRLRGIYGWEPY